MMGMIQLGKETKWRGCMLSQVPASGKCRCFVGHKLQRVGDNRTAVNRDEKETYFTAR